MKAEALIGRVLGTCTLQKLLGQGSMGAVFLAQQSRPNRQVAVKVFLPALPLTPTQHAAFLERFRRETDAAASLEHPNIIPVHEYGERDGLAYLVMPYINGGTLRDQLENGVVAPLAGAKSEGVPSKALPFPTIVNYLDQMAAALEAAHSKGVIHRDIKPANILVRTDGRLLLTDFGLVKVVIEGQSAQMRITSEGAPMGTPDYMAPEQVIGGNVDARADLYSLGVILYQMVTGVTPFTGETPMQIAMQHLHTPPDPPRLLREDLPHAAEQVILRALAKHPEARYSHAKDFSNAFRVSLTAAGIELDNSSAGSLSSQGFTAPRERTFNYSPRSLFDPGWQMGTLSLLPSTMATPPQTGTPVPLAHEDSIVNSNPPSGDRPDEIAPTPGPMIKKKVLGRGIKKGVLRALDGDDARPAIVPPTPVNPLTPAPVSDEATSRDRPYAARATGVQPATLPTPIDAQGSRALMNVTGALQIPTTEHGVTGTLKLTSRAKVVHVPIAGQPGRYVTGLLPAEPEKPHTPPVQMKAVPRPLLRIVLLAAVCVLVASTITVVLVHSRTSAGPTISNTAVRATPNATTTMFAHATATADADVLLFDPLSQNIHSWPIATSGPQIYVFKDGAYHITDNDTVQGAPALLAQMPASLMDKPFAYSITMDEIKGDDASVNNAYGLIVRFSTHTKGNTTVTTFYSLEATNTQNGEYQFWKYDDSYGSSITPWTLLWHQNFGKEYKMGHGPKNANIFKLYMNGTRFTLSVNGKQIAVMKDDSFASGRVGMLVNWKGTEVAYSNLKLTNN